VFLEVQKGTHMDIDHYMYIGHRMTLCIVWCQSHISITWKRLRISSGYVWMWYEHVKWYDT